MIDYMERVDDMLLAMCGSIFAKKCVYVIIHQLLTGSNCVSESGTVAHFQEFFWPVPLRTQLTFLGHC